MSSAWIVGLELFAVLGGVIGFGAWELVRLRRGRSKTSPPPDVDAG